MPNSRILKSVSVKTVQARRFMAPHGGNTYSVHPAKIVRSLNVYRDILDNVGHLCCTAGPQLATWRNFEGGCDSSVPLARLGYDVIGILSTKGKSISLFSGRAHGLRGGCLMKLCIHHDLPAWVEFHGVFWDMGQNCEVGPSRQGRGSSHQLGARQGSVAFCIALIVSCAEIDYP